MGQSGYAESFTTLMLGWIRNVASSIASIFQSGSAGGGASGAEFLSWFSAHWLTLLVCLIVLGMVVDWIVWLVRWRPYWLWFRKRRIVLDDDIDDALSERELMRRYSEDDRPDQPRFRSTALSRDDEDGWDEYDAYAGEYDAYDELDDGYETAGGYADEETDDEPYDEGEAYDDEGEPYDEPYDEADALYEPEEAPDDEAAYDDDWADAPVKPKKKKSLLSRLVRRKADEDPFAVDEDELDLDDDDFYAVVSEEPLYSSGAASERARVQEFTEESDAFEDAADPLIGDIWDDDGEAGFEKPSEGARILPLPDDVDGEDYDERIGYRSSYEPISGTALSRKSRRMRQEGERD